MLPMLLAQRLLEAVWEWYQSLSAKQLQLELHHAACYCHPVQVVPLRTSP